MSILSTEQTKFLSSLLDSDSRQRFAREMLNQLKQSNYGNCNGQKSKKLIICSLPKKAQKGLIRLIKIKKKIIV